MSSRPEPSVDPAERVAEHAADAAALNRRAAALDARARALAERERAVAERESRVDARAIALGLDPVDPAWAVPATAVAIQLRDLMVDTGDDLPTVARGIGLDPDWAQAVLDGDVVEVDVAHVQQLCEGLQCTPYDLFGAEAARSISHLYGPDLWPAAIEPLNPGGWTSHDTGTVGLYDPNPAATLDGPVPMPESPGPDFDLGPSLDL